jgi:CRISPR/Cas system-associated exonuclease Cas4 (RecB family)
LSAIDRLKPLIKGTIYTALGVAVHETIKRYIDLKGPDISIVSEMFKESLFAEMDKIGNADESIRSKFLNDGIMMLNNYIKTSTDNNFLDKTIESEKKHEIARDGYVVVGVIDVVHKNGDSIDVMDYKTSSKAKTQSEADKDLQLSAYGWLYLQKYGIIPSTFNLYFLRMNKIVSTSRTQSDLDEYEKYNAEIYRQMSTETEWAPNTKFCYNCEYIYNCPQRTEAKKVRLI